MPTTVGVLSASHPLGFAMGACALVAYGVAFAATLALPETIGTDLRGVVASEEGFALK